MQKAGMYINEFAFHLYLSLMTVTSIPSPTLVPMGEESTHSFHPWEETCLQTFTPPPLLLDNVWLMYDWQTADFLSY